MFDPELQVDKPTESFLRTDPHSCLTLTETMNLCPLSVPQINDAVEAAHRPGLDTLYFHY